MVALIIYKIFFLSYVKVMDKRMISKRTVPSSITNGFRVQSKRLLCDLYNFLIIKNGLRKKRSTIISGKCEANQVVLLFKQKNHGKRNSIFFAIKLYFNAVIIFYCLEFG